MAYEIGYRKPPASSQFKKGASGNPKGRPKGSRNFLALLEKELSQRIVVSENGKKKSLTRLQAMVKRMVAGALQGDQKQLLVLVEILRRTGSMAPETAENLLPDNYEAILDAYVDSRRGTSASRARAVTNDEPTEAGNETASYEAAGLPRRPSARTSASSSTQAFATLYPGKAFEDNWHIDALSQRAGTQSQGRGEQAHHQPAASSSQIVLGLSGVARLPADG